MADEKPVEDFSDLTRAAAYVRNHAALFRSVLVISDRLGEVEVIDQRLRDTTKLVDQKLAEVEDHRATLEQIATAAAEAQDAIDDANAKAADIIKGARSKAGEIVEQGRRDANAAASDVKSKAEAAVQEINGRAGIARTTLADLNGQITQRKADKAMIEADVADLEGRAQRAREFLAGLAAKV